MCNYTDIATYKFDNRREMYTFGFWRNNENRRISRKTQMS